MCDFIETERIMKKVVRTVIPLLLVLAIIACTGWYFLKYDRELTKDILLSAARYFERRGDLSTSTWFYNHAYKQVGDNDAIAIELANQYKASGNYTKAEFTLTNAIAEGGGKDLYIALSKLFVEQDKLYDATKMLDGITNKDIKAQLELMRPATPTCSRKEGEYSQYIKVDVLAASGTLYVNTSSPYHSMQSDLYDHSGITLKDGDNTIYAVAVDENGLVSRLATFNFKVTNVVKELTFTDPAIELAIRDQLQFSFSKPIYTSDLWTIQEFTVPEDAKDLSDLKHLTALKKLVIEKGPAGQLEHIAKLEKLDELTITETAVLADELQLIGKLPALKKLTLKQCSLSTVANLDLAKGLVYLDLSGNAIRDIRPLAELQNLEELNLTQNALNDLQALVPLKELTALYVGSNELTTLSPLSDLTKIRLLDVSNNLLTDLTGITQYTTLEELNISKNKITDISVLGGNTGLVELNVAENSIVDISVLAELTKVKVLDFSNNRVAALPKLDKNCALSSFNGAQNLLTSIDALAGLEHLNYINVEYNVGITSISKLATCPRLVKLDVFGTKVTEVKEFEEMGIWVNYDPTAKK